MILIVIAPPSASNHVILIVNEKMNELPSELPLGLLEQRFYSSSRRGSSTRTVNNVADMANQELAEQVDALYDLKLMTRFLFGYLFSKGYPVSQPRVASALWEVAPEAYEGRRNDLLERSNPVPYLACHFGHKIHMDQNEKLSLFGVTSVIARDGYSGKIVAFGIMPVKNCIAIYDLVFRKAVIENGLWHQVRVDHGREFYLVLRIQDHLRTNCGPRSIASYVQSPSTENLTPE
uniref:Uncharacterized protein n=1 Tax=Amphimedon queenslandica TaxID=400682 RepID=A0A1X7TLJ1_AMPQE